MRSRVRVRAGGRGSADRGRSERLPDSSACCTRLRLRAGIVDRDARDASKPQWRHKPSQSPVRTPVSGEQCIQLGNGSTAQEDSWRV